MSIGAVLDEAWTLFTRFFLRFFAIALVVFATINLLCALVVTAFDADNDNAAILLAIVPLLVAGLLAGICIALGFVLLIVPGLILLTIWTGIAPVIVIEQTPALDAFGRPRVIVRGHGWTVFAIVLVTGLPSCIAFLPRLLEILIGSAIAQAVVAPFGAIAVAITYVRLRETHAGTGAPVVA